MVQKLTALVISGLVLVGVGTILAGSALASGTTQTVKGTILADDTPVPSASVTVTCEDYNSPHHLMANTSGKYTTTFSSNVCPVGKHITVVATNGADSGTTTAVLAAGTSTIDVNVISVALPEFMTVTIGVAGLGAAIAIWLIRRRAEQQA